MNGSDQTVARLARLRASGILSQVQYLVELEELMDGDAVRCIGGSSKEEGDHVNDDSDGFMVDEDGELFAPAAEQRARAEQEQEAKSVSMLLMALMSVTTITMVPWTMVAVLMAQAAAALAQAAAALAQILCMHLKAW